ncbi:MAG TPA: right-handed parallel beta-helix repeat-containing protein [Bryobacteraceae bacterium]|nr:right-handed parallel beta-helix repeat-containing protein [Bryobacteraceae bacterium]
MKNSTLMLKIVVTLLACRAVQAIEISGVITSTLNVAEDSWLTGDVACRVQGGPCLRVTASNITLWLNGFTMTGLADPPAGCLPKIGNIIDHGISITGQRRVEVFGPGLIQKFPGWGIELRGTTRSTVRDVTVSGCCASGIQLIAAANDNVVEGVVSERNGSTEFPCGGICLSNANGNRLRRNIVSGNGYAVMDVVNFGIALLGTSRGNTIIDNTGVGNVNGIFLQPNTLENLIHRNIFSGNAPIQIPVSLPEFQGFDIRNQAPEGANNILDNVCLSYSGAGRSPCPSVIRP